MNWSSYNWARSSSSAAAGSARTAASASSARPLSWSRIRSKAGSSSYRRCAGKTGSSSYGRGAGKVMASPHRDPGRVDREQLGGQPDRRWIGREPQLRMGLGLDVGAEELVDVDGHDARDALDDADRLAQRYRLGEAAG